MQPSPLATPVAWNLVAPAYAAEVVPLFETYAREALRLAAPPAGGRLIDVACGPGTLSLLAARAGHPVDAVDFSPGMISELEGRLAAAGITSIAPRLADGQALPFEDGAFAAGFSMFGLMFFPDRARGFAELRRVLAPGSRAVVSSWMPLDTVPVMGAMMAAVGKELARLLPDGPPPAPPSFPLTSEEDCRREMGAAFDRVEVHRVSHEERYASAGDLWQQLARTMAPLVLLRQTLGEERWPEVSATAERAIADAIGDRPAAMTMTALCSVGRAA